MRDLLNKSSRDDFEELRFWGRVGGTQKDYFVAIGITYSGKYEFPSKRFYFATSADFVFGPFPEINSQHGTKYDELTGPFTGNPDHVIVKVVEDKEEEEVKEVEEVKERDPLEDTEEEDPNKDFVARNLIEADRLHYTVLAIENDCSIVPHGSYRLTERHEVARNVAFRGLPQDKTFSLDSYMHFRNVQSAEKARLLTEADAVFQGNFLDDITCDLPKGQWSVQRNSTGRTAVIRNHVWPGFTAFHTTGTQVFGHCYIGDGQKNTDFAFYQ